MANIVTCIRIVCSIALLFCRALSLPFYVLYIAAGLTDMADGAIARKTNTVSESGSRLDTAADFIFVTVCLVKLLPVLNVSVRIYAGVLIIAFIKAVNVIYGYVVQKKIAAAHTVLNKITGAFLFVIPLTLGFIPFEYTAAAACAIAFFAAIREGQYIRTGKVIE